MVIRDSHLLTLPKTSGCPYLTPNEGWVSALRVKDGKALWEANLPGTSRPQIVYSNNRLYAIGGDGVVSAYGLQ